MVSPVNDHDWHPGAFTLPDECGHKLLRNGTSRDQKPRFQRCITLQCLVYLTQ
jgi:hypothetical protein